MKGIEGSRKTFHLHTDDFDRGRERLHSDTIPLIRPPPPTGTTMHSTSGICSRISSPTVP